MTHQIIFDMRKGLETSGKILVKAALSGGETTFTLNVKVTSPSGVLIKDYPSTGYDVTNATALAGGNALVSIPTTLEGKWEPGTYNFAFMKVINGMTATQGTFSHNFVPLTAPNSYEGLATLAMTMDCASLTVKTTDKTLSPVGWTFVSRVLRLIKPPTPSNAAPVTTTTSTTVLTAAVDYENISYTSDLTLTYTRTIPDPTTFFDIIENMTLTAFATKLIVCTTALCSLLKCASDIIFNAFSKRCIGGVDAIDPKELNRANMISALLSLNRAAYDCGDSNIQEDTIEKLKLLIPSDCPCGAGTPYPVAG